MDAIRSNWREAELSARALAMLAFAENLTRAPADCSASDVEELRRVGMQDKEILALVMLVGFFNLATRVADALGVELDPQLTRGTKEYERFFSKEPR